MTGGKATGILVIIYLLLLAGGLAAAWYLVMPPSPPFSADDWKSLGGAGSIVIAAISALMSAFLSIRAMGVQSKASLDLERVKQVLAKRIPAHGDLYGAALSYYRALAPLETGNFYYELIEAAESTMKGIEGHTVYVDEQFSSSWMAFWQRSRYLKEKVNSGIGDPEARTNFWRQEAGQLGEMLRSLKIQARQELR